MTQAEIIGYNSAVPWSSKTSPLRPRHYLLSRQKKTSSRLFCTSPTARSLPTIFEAMRRFPGFFPSICKRKVPALKGDIWKSSRKSPSTGNTLEPCSTVRHASMESARKTVRKYSHHICAGFRSVRTLCLFEAAGFDLKAHSALGRHDANGFFKQELCRPAVKTYGTKLAD